MDYKRIQIDYAKRSIENYEKVHNLIDHEFTFISGTILAVLTALIPDGIKDKKEIIIGFEEDISLPKYNKGRFSNVVKYLYNIRNALAHKTNNNFSTNSVDGKIVGLRLSSNNRPSVILNFEDLKILLEYLKLSIEKHDASLRG